jgi:hypothetical protein
MPNPGKPAESKRLTNSRHYKPNSVVYVLPKAEETPEPMGELGESGLRLWHEAWQLGRNWISTKSDYSLLLMTCQQLDERDILRAYVLENIEAWHERAGLRVLERDIASNLSALGFTPTDRMKLGLAEVKTVSKLDELMERKANRVASTMVDTSSAE